jgi:hypothetical protein
MAKGETPADEIRRVLKAASEFREVPTVAFTPRYKPSDESCHTVTMSGQEIFLDYFRLKGVTSFEFRMNAGDVPRLTIELIVAGATYVEPEKD